MCRCLAVGYARSKYNHANYYPHINAIPIAFMVARRFQVNTIVISIVHMFLFVYIPLLARLLLNAARSGLIYIHIYSQHNIGWSPA